jgi:hypothetical protein
MASWLEERERPTIVLRTGSLSKQATLSVYSPSWELHLTLGKYLHSADGKGGAAAAAAVSKYS